MAATMSPEALRRRAIGRALANGGAGAVTRVKYGLYRVASATRPGVTHTVSVDVQGRYWCSCEAGLAGKPCHHKASVYIAKVESGGGRVTGPAPAAELPQNVTPLRRVA